MDTTPFIERLLALLPGWNIETVEAAAPDAVLRLQPPRGPEAILQVEAKPRLSAREASTLASAVAPPDSLGPGETFIIFAEFITSTARERLRDAGISYLDLTGNTWIRIVQPTVLIDRQGAKTDPDPPRKGARSLKGAKAARIVRALCDGRPPVGVRELARKTRANPGYVTRVLSLLEQEDVVFRGEAGEVTDVRWPDLLRRWTSDYDVTGSNRPFPCLAPRGIPAIFEELANVDDRYAVTGSFAVPPEARIVPSQLLSLYATSPRSLVANLDLRPTRSGANVLVLEPFDGVVFEGARTVDGLTLVSPTQCVADLWTGGSRDPRQGDALVAWMMEHEDVWRA